MIRAANAHAMEYLQNLLKMSDRKHQSAMDSNPVPEIAVVAANGWVFRNLLETGLLQRAGILDQVTILLDSSLAEDGAPVLEQYAMRYEIVDFDVSPFLLLVKSLALYLDVFRNAPQYSANKFRGATKRVFWWALRLFQITGLLGPIYISLIWLLERRLRREGRGIDMSRFDLFLSASPNALQDNMVGVRARQMGCPVVNVILSWDNLFSKGYMVPADLFVVWGDAMAKQLTALFDVPPCQITALGAPHIGGLRPQNGTVYPRDTLLYSTAAAVHFPDEKELVKKLAQDFAAGTFSDFSRLIIRTHPAGPNELYDDLASPEASIFVDHPTNLGKRDIFRWMPDVNELKHLGKLLSRVSLAVNMASTMTLDCLVHGVHVINVTAALNGRDLSQHYRSEHYSCLLDLNLVRLVGSYGDLVDAIQSARKTTDLVIATRIQSFIIPTDAVALESFRTHLISLSAARTAARKDTIIRGS